MTRYNKKVGQLFIIGFPDESPSKMFLEFVREAQPGGVILFENNCPTHQAVEDSIAVIKEQYTDTSPFIAIDQEGGRVCRLRGVPAEFGAASEYADKDEIERFAEEYSRAMVYLDSLGINLNLNPVADIGFEDAGGCLEGRTFGNTPDQVARFVSRAVNIAKSKRVLSCLKHFPGLGAAKQDPHEETSTANYDIMMWEQREMIPFSAGVDNGADLIMTTHLRLPNIDDQIVTGSKKIISEMIRHTVGFEGPIVTDDLTMKGAQALGHIGERTVRAFVAGHDLLLFGQNIDLAMEAYEYFLNAMEYGEVQQSCINESLSRIAGTKFRLAGSVV